MLTQHLRTVIAWLFAVVASQAAAQNVIQTENAKTSGVTSQWFISDANYASNREIEGYASATSVARGGSINLYVQTSGADTSYTINVYRVGWYGGAGGRLMAGPITRSRVAQPSCPMIDSATRLVECSWIDPYVLTIPNNTGDASDWASGVYLAKLTGATTGKQSYIIFVVRDDARSAAIMFQTSVTTYAAYNNWGGYDFYDSDSIGGTPAAKVSFNRPYSNGQRHMNGKGTGDFLSWEINMLRFVEREGYDVQYATNIDTHTSPGRLLNRRAFLSVGHDEYYTREMYDAVQAARDSGVNLAFFGANNIYWQIRLEPSSTGQASRTMVGYKWATDPVQGPTSTYLWRETARAPINRPEAALIGVMYDYNTVDLDMVVADCSSWICAGTGLTTGAVLPGMLGYEVDRVAPSSPPGITIITSSPYDVCTGQGCERRFANSTYYTAGSGAGVFATGSMNWNWGVDAFTSGPLTGKDDDHGDRSNAAVQQITRNVLNSFAAGGGGNGAPSITSTPIIAATVGVAYSYDVNATDPNGDTLTYSLTTAPSGMTINATSGLIAWTPTAAQGGNHSVTVRVADPGGLAATQSFTINVAGGTAPSTTRVDLATPASIVAPPGGSFSITLNWYRMPMAANYLQFMHLVSSSGQVTSVDDHWTTSASWSAGGFSEIRTISVPSSMALGTYDIRVGLSGGSPWVDQALVAGSGVTDPAGDHRYKVGTLTVGTGNAAPTITSTAVTSATVGVAYSYDVNATDPNGDTLTYSLTTAPSGMTISASTGLIAWTPSAGQTGNQAVTVRVADPGGLAATQSFTVAVGTANAAPTITSTAVTSASVGVAYSYDVNATDPNGDTLTYSLTTAPSGMTINSASGLISWTPTSTQAGTQAVTVRVADPGGLAATQAFNITVAGGGNGAPSITSTPIIAATVGVAYSYDVNATDPNGDTLTYSLTTAPSGMTINATSGLIAWTPTAAQGGNHSVTVRVADPGGLAATQSFTINVAGGTAPSTTRVDLATPASIVAPPGGSFSITLNWYRMPMAANYLQFMHLVSSSGQVTSVDDHWTTSASWSAGGFSEIRTISVPSSMALGTYDIRVGLSGGSPWVDQALVAGSGVTDPAGDHRYKVGTLTVGTGNAAPTITSTAVTSATVGVAYSYDVNATDPNGDTLTYSLTTAPSGMTISASTGLIAWTPSAGQTGNQAVTVRVADPGGLAATQSFTVAVGTANAAPTITSTAVTSASVGVAYSYDVNATDPNGDTLTYSLTTAPSGMTINSASGLISWTPTSTQAGTQAVTVRVADPGGLAATQAFNITVAGGGNGAPSITSTPIIAATVGVAYSYDVNATDPNGDTLTYSLTTAPSGMTINATSGLIAWTPTAAQGGNHSVTVRVADPGGLAATQSFTVNVAAANVAPTITSTAVTSATVGVAYSYDVNASDPNGDALTYSLTTAPSGMTINASSGLIAWTPTTAQAGNRAVTVRVADPGGLAATQSFTINVASGPAPSTTRVDLATPATYTAARGTVVNITLNWYRMPMAANYLQFMHLQNAAGTFWSVDDHWTTSASWTAGVTSETRAITVPTSIASGTYDIRVGLSGGSPWADLALVLGSGVTDPGNVRKYKVGTLVVP